MIDCCFIQGELKRFISLLPGFGAAVRGKPFRELGTCT
jgi:hypothetical protein